MKMKLSPWCKSVKIELVKKDWTVKQLSEAVGMRPEYTSSVINGRVISEQAARKISDVLNIEQIYFTSSE